jgi:N-formylglutamate amidohydrolase
MTEDDATHRLGEALNHLHAFAATLNQGDYVDEESALTAEDVNVILDTLEKVHAIASVAAKL